MKECFVPNHLLSFLCGMWSRLDEHDTLKRVQTSTCVKMMLMLCLIKMNEILFIFVCSFFLF